MPCATSAVLTIHDPMLYVNYIAQHEHLQNCIEATAPLKNMSVVEISITSERHARGEVTPHQKCLQVLNMSITNGRQDLTCRIACVSPIDGVFGVRFTSINHNADVYHKTERDIYHCSKRERS